MKLKAIDQLHISAVKPDSLRPGEAFEVSDAAGQALLKAHPGKVQRLDVDGPQNVGQKAERQPDNKAEKAPPNKAETKGRAK
jgi:hypothetical protein